jgi:hypothetical protein
VPSTSSVVVHAPAMSAVAVTSATAQRTARGRAPVVAVCWAGSTGVGTAAM